MKFKLACGPFGFSETSASLRLKRAEVAFGAILLGCLSLTGCATLAPAPEAGGTSTAVYDVLIRNGTVYDGLGGPGIPADVAVRGDRIVAVGPGLEGSAELVVDASGLAVAPGFINMLSWATESLIEDPRSQSDIRQGVTLEVFGEGWSMGPLSDTMKALERSQQGDIRFPIEWTTLGEYLEYLERRGVATNVASFVGATTVRIHELGYEDRAPTAAELERMRGLVRQAMEEGALGVGSSLIYAPAFYAGTDELVALADEAGRYGGMYISHMRSEGNALLEAVDELITIARRARVPAEIYHLKQAGTENWDKLDDVIERVEAARAEGLRITADMYTYTAGATGLDAAMPPWVQEGGLEQWKRRLQDPQIRDSVLTEMRTPTDEWESLYLLAGSPERVLLVGFKQDSLKYLTGKTLAEVAKLRGTSPEETALDLVVADDSRVGTVYFLMSEENVRRQVALPWMTFGSDAGSLAPEGVFLRSNPHPRAYGNFARLLGKYVREEEVIPLGEAIRKLTSQPARNLKLRGRGELRPGYHADIVIFDPATITDHATFEEPHQYATGVRHVFVNGVRVLADGEHTGALPGQVVRGPGWTGWRSWWERSRPPEDWRELNRPRRGDGSVPGSPGTAEGLGLDRPGATEALVQELRDATADVPAEVSLVLLDLESGAEVDLNGDRVLHAASTMKVPVLLELFRQAAAGERSLGETVVVRDSFTSIADGSRYRLDAESDTERELYGKVGQPLPLGDLARRMIVRSSNLATNLLIEEVGAERVRATLARLGAEEIVVLRGVEDIPAYERGMNNTTTARALAKVLAAIARCEAGDVTEALRPLTPEHCARIVGILAEQEITGRIPAGVAPGVRVANKTGTITRIVHDAAIIYPHGRAPYVLVVLTRGLDAPAAAPVIRGLSSRVWRHMGRQEAPGGG